MSSSVFTHPGLPGHAVLDSGGGEKLERFGSVTLRRPDPQALWRKRLSAEWDQADLSFERESDRGGRWMARNGAKIRDQWTADVGGAEVLIRPTPFKHVGLFPEQAANWQWLESRRQAIAGRGGEPPRLLNLFGYTGVATVLAAKAGWKVTHVDASKQSLDWAAANAAHNQLPGDAVRWMADDAAAFVAREVRRERRYEAILLDPPHYGRGPKGEKWQFETSIAPLVENCWALLADGPAALVLSTYAIGYSPLAFENLFRDGPAGAFESGELALPEEGGERALPCGYCARWWRD